MGSLDCVKKEKMKKRRNTNDGAEEKEEKEKINNVENGTCKPDIDASSER